MNYKVRFDLKSEDGNYLLYALDSNGFVDNVDKLLNKLNEIQESIVLHSL